MIIRHLCTHPLSQWSREIKLDFSYLRLIQLIEMQSNANRPTIVYR